MAGSGALSRRGDGLTRVLNKSLKHGTRAIESGDVSFDAKWNCVRHSVRLFVIGRAKLSDSFPNSQLPSERVVLVGF